ncbi:uncharacterized protein B0H18DRAFT_1181251 [Fomitopsis serialis]|uniref:uncharacterized protein n=1 Tax=Fomitopsis serialis TaxID=139415 RepID=UPI00200784B2|nr:uncharacterized protein B0H18DRAFT_1181251 [Neoantrodia serialis]KAH9934761.1 hypothetical protein B0H18DRAFT_1181251 [Neoantrodia serialis]
MGLCDLAMLGWTFTRARGTRLFHQIGIIVLTTATIAYFAMASDLGAAPVTEEFLRGGTNTLQSSMSGTSNGSSRSRFYFLTAACHRPHALRHLHHRLHGLGVGHLRARRRPRPHELQVGLLRLRPPRPVLHLARPPRLQPALDLRSGGAVRSGYIRTAAYFSLLLMLYPICWACAEGGNVISVTGEMIWYGILDLLAGPVFLFFFLFGLRSVDMAAFGLWSGKYTDTGYGPGGGAGGPGMAAAPGANGVTAGTGAGVGPGAGAGPATANGVAAASGGAAAANRV